MGAVPGMVRDARDARVLWRSRAAWARSRPACRLGEPRKLATLVATVAYLEGRAADDCPGLLDLLMTTGLSARAEKAAGAGHKRRHPSLVLHSVRLAAAVEALLDVAGAGEAIPLAQAREPVEAVVPHGELRESVDAAADMAPPPRFGRRRRDAGPADRADRRGDPVPEDPHRVVAFGAASECAQALAAVRALPRLLGRRTRITAADIDPGLLAGSRRTLVMPASNCAGAAPAGRGLGMDIPPTASPTCY
jgi:hypothetical protein